MKYASARRTTDLTGLARHNFYPLTIQSIVNDTDGFFDLSRPTTVLIPSGMTRARFMAGFDIQDGINKRGNHMTRFMKVGSPDTPVGVRNAIYTDQTGYSNVNLSNVSEVLEVAPGDEYFTQVYLSGQTSTQTIRGSIASSFHVWDCTNTKVAQAKLTNSLLSGYDFTGGPVIVPFDAVGIDDFDAWDASEPNRLTVPTGVSKVRLRVSINLNDSGESTNQFSFAQITVLKNGYETGVWPGGDALLWATGPLYLGGVRTIDINYLQANFPAIDVLPGDYFEMQIEVTPGASDVDGFKATGGWQPCFEMEMLDYDR